MAEDAEDTLDWLRGKGAKFVKGGAVEFMRWVLARRPAARPRLERSRSRCPARNLTAATEAGGGTPERSVCGKELIVEGGRVVGITAERAGETIEFHAPAVVICDGGFQAIPTWWKYIAPSRKRSSREEPALVAVTGCAWRKALVRSLSE